ncbi:hypothetical protein D3C80_2026000 [compost metagenome]
MQQQAGDTQPLLGPQRQHPIPVVALLQARRQPGDPGTFERMLDFRLTEMAGGVRVAERRLQGAVRQERTLWQEHDALPGGQANLAPPPGP